VRSCAANVECAREREKVRRKLIEGALRERAKPPGRVGFEKMCAAVDGVHRLSAAGFAGIMPRKLLVRAPQWFD
jgi:hypothetical protein